MSKDSPSVGISAFVSNFFRSATLFERRQCEARLVRQLQRLLNPALMKSFTRSLFKDMDTNRQSIPDALIHWTTSGALIAFGVIFFDDASVMGRTILALGILSAANEGLKLRAVRRASNTGYRWVRLSLAVAYVSLVLIGFLFPPSGT